MKLKQLMKLNEIKPGKGQKMMKYLDWQDAVIAIDKNFDIKHSSRGGTSSTGAYQEIVTAYSKNKIIGRFTHDGEGLDDETLGVGEIMKLSEIKVFETDESLNKPTRDLGKTKEGYKITARAVGEDNSGVVYEKNGKWYLRLSYPYDDNEKDEEFVNKVEAHKALKDSCGGLGESLDEAKPNTF